MLRKIKRDPTKLNSIIRICLFTILSSGFFSSLISCSNSSTGTISEATSTPPCLLDLEVTEPCSVDITNVVVTGSFGSDISQWNNSQAQNLVSATLPDAYYKSKVVSLTDPSLVAANIKSGTTIFGVSGIYDSTLDQCSSNGLQSVSCMANIGSYWTTSLGTSVSLSQTISTPIPEGYYDGTLDCSVTDANLTATHIKSGVSILGVAGNVASNFPTCTDNSLNGQTCVTSSTAPQNRFICSPSNLAASNIRTGVSICGLTGTYSGPPGNAFCTDDQLNAIACTTNGGGHFVTAATGNFVNGVNGTLTMSLPLGFYDGTKRATASDSQLIASNIKLGTSIFGVTGSVTAIDPSAQGYPPCSNNNLNTVQCLTATNRYVTANTGSTITTWSNPNSSSSITGIIPSGFYTGGNNINFTESNLLAKNILKGISIFNVVGNLVNGSKNSNTYHDQTNTPMLQSTETSTYAGVPLPTPYRTVPIIGKDDDGYVNAGITSSQVNGVVRNISTGAEWNTGVPRIVCGKGTVSLNAKIASCASQHTTRPNWDAGLDGEISWNGAAKANAGQSSWTLVSVYAALLANGATCDTTCKEVWLDNQTGLLWSDKLTNSDNWCRASGNAEATDPSNFCNNTTYQPSFTTAQSWCAEVGPTTMAPVDGSGENWSVNTYHAAKGGLGTKSLHPVYWRLPSEPDYLSAETNGIRFVLPGMADSVAGAPEWTATLQASAANIANAWRFSGTDGSLDAAPRSDVNALRCIGRTAYLRGVALLMHMNGANNSTSFIDQVDNVVTNTVAGTKISTTQSKFGGASTYFNGTGVLTIPNTNSQYSFRTGDFTIELWVKPVSGYRIVGTLQHSFSSEAGWTILWNGNASLTFASVDATTTSLSTPAAAAPANAWTHVAVVRHSGTLTIYINGVSAASALNSSDMLKPTTWTSNLILGAKITDGGGYDDNFTGYVDDLQIIKGYAKYTETFTPPTSALPDN